MNKFLETKSLDSVRKIKLVCHIDPAEITHFPQVDFSIEDASERASAGNWDLDLIPIKTSKLYQTFSDVFFHDKTWITTDYYADELQKNSILCERDRDYYKRTRCAYLDYLFNAMKSFGYVQDPLSDLVGICIGRNGEIILNNGRHRVVAAQLLSIPSIPVTIDVRHEEWTKFCSLVNEYALMHRGRVYAPITHVDLKALPSRQEDRSDLIVSKMSPKGGSLVDLGANWGGMCQRLEGYFDSCTAVEVDPVEAAFLRRFKRAYGCSYEIVEKDAVDFIKERSEWDCVLMMSILHHIPIERRDELFEKLNAKEMFFQFPSKEELEVDVAAWIQLILNASCFSKVKQLTKTDREIFHFTR